MGREQGFLKKKCDVTGTNFVWALEVIDGFIYTTYVFMTLHTATAAVASVKHIANGSLLPSYRYI